MALDLSSLQRRKTDIELSGRSFTFTELTLGDMAAFRARIQEQRRATRQERRERLIADAKTLEDIDGEKILEMLDKPLTDEDYEAEAETIEGVIYLAFLSLKHHHIEITEPDVQELIGVSDIEAVVAAMLPQEDKKKSSTRKRSRSPGALPSPSRSGGIKGPSGSKTSQK